MQVTWVKCGSGTSLNWCPLEKVNLADVETTGVYIIWHDGNPGRVVRVGQGIIKDRLSAHRNDRRILAYRQNGTLRVTWASVPYQFQRDGIEKYLAQTWVPLVGDAYPDVLPIAVNSPWS